MILKRKLYTEKEKAPSEISEEKKRILTNRAMKKAAITGAGLGFGGSIIAGINGRMNWKGGLASTAGGAALGAILGKVGSSIAIDRQNKLAREAKEKKDKEKEKNFADAANKIWKYNSWGKDSKNLGFFSKLLLKIKRNLAAKRLKDYKKQIDARYNSELQTALANNSHYRDLLHKDGQIREQLAQIRKEGKWQTDENINKIREDLIQQRNQVKEEVDKFMKQFPSVSTQGADGRTIYHHWYGGTDDTLVKKINKQKYSLETLPKDQQKMVDGVFQVYDHNNGLAVQLSDARSALNTNYKNGNNSFVYNATTNINPNTWGHKVAAGGLAVALPGTAAVGALAYHKIKTNRANKRLEEV